MVQSRTAHVQFAAPTDNTRTAGDNSRFAPVGRQDLADLLAPHGFQEVAIDGTNEIVLARTLTRKDGAQLQLRVYSGANKNGEARPRGQDAIRTQLWTLGPVAGRVRGAKRTMRVFTWRKNLLRKLKQLCDWFRDEQSQPAEKALPVPEKPLHTPQVNPKCPKCGGPTFAPKQGKHGPFHGCRAYPKCHGAVNVRDVR